MKKRLAITLLLTIILAGVLNACSSSATIQDETETSSSALAIDETTSDPGAESDESSKTQDDPDYELVFPDDKVNEIVITIEPENYTAMMDDMTENYGEFGSGEDRMGGGRMGEDRGFQPPQQQAPALDDPQLNEDQAEQVPPAIGDARPQDAPGRVQPDGELPFQDERARGGMGMAQDSKDNPIWVEATIEFNGETWEHIGIRYKGNSSLRSSWSSGSYKIPFKLDFDQFEDEYTETEDQRLYGFKQLSFSSNFSDTSYLREFAAADIFRDAGVPSAQTAFYAVYIDTGNGLQYYGLYTAVEVIDDTVIETQFEDDSGNVYKPSGAAATFAEGTFNIQAFDKETNIDEADYSDVEKLYQVLHDSTRLTDPEEWKRELEAVFDVDIFLKWLATNTLIQNWDTYGSMSHNYYLYHDPTTDKLVWIPWDNNMALGSNFARNPINTLDLSSVSEDWPLIRYLLDDEEYLAKYNTYLEEITLEVFNPERMQQIYSTYHELIEEYVQKEQPGYTSLSNMQAFENSVTELVNHTQERYQAAMTYLASLQ